MAELTTYKTVIQRAIDDFNSIQNELYKIGAKRSDGSTALTESTTPIATNELGTIIKNQLQLKPTGHLMVSSVGNDEIHGGNSYYIIGDGNVFSDLSTFKDGCIKKGSIAISGGGLSADSISPSITKPTVTINASGSLTETLNIENYGIKKIKPDGVDGKAYLTIGKTTSSSDGSVSGSTTVTRGAVDSGSFSEGWIKSSDFTGLDSASTNVEIASTTIGSDITDNFTPFYIPIVTPSFNGGTLSASDRDKIVGSITGGGLTIKDSNIIPQLSMSLKDTRDKNANDIFGSTEIFKTGSVAKENGYDYFVTLNGSSAETTSTVTREKIEVSEFSQKVVKSKLAYKDAVKGLVSVADGTTVSDESSITITFDPQTKDATSETINIAAGSYNGVVGIKKATFTNAEKNVLSAPKISLNTSTDKNNDSSMNITSALLGSNGTESSAEPSSAYYIRLNTSTEAGGTSTIKSNQAGFVESGVDVGSAAVELSGSNDQIFAVNAAKCTVSGGELTASTATGGDLTGGALSGGNLEAGAGSVSSEINNATGIKGINISNDAISGELTTTEPTDLFYFSFKASGSGSVSRKEITRDAVNFSAFSQTINRGEITDAHTAGFIPSKDSSTAISADSKTVSINAKTIEASSISEASLSSNTATSTYYIPVKSGSLISASKSEATTGAYTNYLELSAPVIDEEGYLIINHGYYTDSKISLATLIPDDADYTNAGNSQIRLGFEAYSTDGVKLIGTMPDVTPEFYGGIPNSNTWITANAVSPENHGPAINYNTTIEVGSEYVTISATGQGGASPLTYADSYAGYLSVSSETVVSERVKTTSKDTNYIPALTLASAETNAATFTTRAEITAKAASDIGARPTSGNDRGYAVNSSSVPSSMYVKIEASAAGTGFSGSSKVLEVKDKYMLSNISVSSPAPEEVNSEGDVNYILADATTSYYANPGSFNTTASITNRTAEDIGARPTSGDDRGYAVVTDSPSGAYVKISATSSGTSAAGVASPFLVKDKYMLNNVDILCSQPTIGSTSGDEACIPVFLTTSTESNAGSVSGSCNSPTIGTMSDFSNGNLTAGAKTETVSVSISSNTGGSASTLLTKDTYLVDNISISGRASAVDISNGTATIAADATGENVDGAVLSLYRRMLGMSYNSVE